MGPEEDHWITAWSPQAVTKRKEAFVACVPNLVRSFTTTPDQSTWGRGRDQSDAPLARDPND
ncbi:MAG: hypothetical protein DWQ08_00585 [Proteobacteria bacterium]|nr:MAG: hypothetical protein DWQ08_00585 [Pseudomonadota bacterium]